MKKTNFDCYLDRQLRDPAFAARFKRAGEAWDVALQISALREKAGLSQKDLARLKDSETPSEGKETIRPARDKRR